MDVYFYGLWKEIVFLLKKAVGECLTCFKNEVFFPSTLRAPI